MRIERGRIEERGLRFEERKDKRIEAWDGNRSEGIAHHSSQTSNPVSYTHLTGHKRWGTSDNISGTAC